MSLKRTNEEWREIKDLALRIRHTPLGNAIREELARRADAHLVTFEDENALDLRVRQAQAARNAHIRDIIIIDDLIRQADVQIKRSTNARRED